MQRSDPVGDQHGCELGHEYDIPSSGRGLDLGGQPVTAKLPAHAQEALVDVVPPKTEGLAEPKP